MKSGPPAHRAIVVRRADLEEADAETEQEDFLVLSGEALLIVEGQERNLRRWDFSTRRRRGTCLSVRVTGRA